MEPTLKGAAALARSATGPLSPHLPAFVMSLIDQGYAVVCVRAKSWRAVDFDRWLAQEGIDLVDVSDVHVVRYHRRSGRPRSDCRAEPRRNQLAALNHLLCFLREQDACSPAPSAALPADDMAASFEQFLLRQRGLAPATVGGYRATVRGFLAHRFGDQRIDLGAMHANDIIDFVRREARRLQPKGLKHVVSSLRAFLRYAEFRGEIDASLIHAVPAVAVWTTTPPLPRAISAEHARLAIASCDPDTAVGRRDRAILLTLARLGLRAAEIIALTLDDVDWEAGHLRIHGKNRRDSLLPLPVDVGEAIAAYLQNGRPTCADRHLFLRTRAPIRGLLYASDGVGSIVRNALQRAKVDAPHKGSHQFRHALAVRMLRGGTSLSEIGEVLRHSSPLSTSIYAKVDLAALRPLAMPWPGSAS